MANVQKNIYLTIKLLGFYILIWLFGSFLSTISHVLVIF
jgi:hypothetical protein